MFLCVLGLGALRSYCNLCLLGVKCMFSYGGSRFLFFSSLMLFWFGSGSRSLFPVELRYGELVGACWVSLLLSVLCSATGRTLWPYLVYGPIRVVAISVF